MDFMDTIEVSFFPYFLFFFFIFSNISAMTNEQIYAMENECSASKCGDNPFVIRFPFNLNQSRTEKCGYPGFDLSCTSFGKTILELPLSGKFYVREINYVTQEIRLHDPRDCLPRRLLSLDLSGSPFQSVHYQNYTFLNCSSNFTTSQIAPIDCLSSDTNKILATPSMTLAGLVTPDCEIIKTVSLPIERPLHYENGFSTDLDNDLFLSWDEPDCSHCESMGWRCRFNDNSNNNRDTACFHVPVNGPSTTTNESDTRDKERYRMAMGIVIPAFVLSIFLVCYMCFWFGPCDCCNRHDPVHFLQNPQAAATDDPSSMVIMVGLDGTTIESYPKLVLGESRRVPIQNGGTCPICLIEYLPQEILRSIPDCNHCFHADCIDEWLRLNASCPLCRTSPSPLASPEPVHLQTL